MHMKGKRKYLLGVLAIIVVVSCYVFCPMSIRMELRGLRGEKIHEYQYSESGRAVILLDSNEKTVSFVDTNEIEPFGILGIRGYAVYNLQLDKITKVSGYDNPQNQYGYITDYNDTVILVSIQVPKTENGKPDLHLYQFGLSKEGKEDGTLFQKDVFGKTVFAKYVTSW